MREKLGLPDFSRVHWKTGEGLGTRPTLNHLLGSTQIQNMSLITIYWLINSLIHVIPQYPLHKDIGRFGTHLIKSGATSLNQMHSHTFTNNPEIDKGFDNIISQKLSNLLLLFTNFVTIYSVTRAGGSQTVHMAKNGSMESTKLYMY